MIELKHVSFAYQGQEHDGLHDINLTIADGECVLFCGRSGCGKTTITRLVNGLIPQFYAGELTGSVLVDGQEISKLPMYQIAAKVGSVFQNPRTQFFNVDTDSEIAFGIENEARPPVELAERVEQATDDLHIVFQKTFLTRDSVLENIRMGSSASLEQVRAAAKEAQIDDFIMSLPDGYDTKVGSFGSRFSGGEKQRIAIARAILKNAPILILDEATSASDPENQMEIDRAIQNLCKGKTVIVVAHRLSALKMCERVAVVEDHTITCAGTHEEVRRDNAYYRKAWEDYEKARNITYQLEGGRGE